MEVMPAVAHGGAVSAVAEACQRQRQLGLGHDENPQLLGSLPGLQVLISGVTFTPTKKFLSGPWSVFLTALLDTGSQINVIEAQLCRMLRGTIWRGPTLSLHGLGGKKEVPEVALLQLSIDGSDEPRLIACYVTSHLPRLLILGQAFLEYEDSIINLRERIFYFGNHISLLHSDPTKEVQHVQKKLTGEKEIPGPSGAVLRRLTSMQEGLVLSITLDARASRGSQGERIDDLDELKNLPSATPPEGLTGNALVEVLHALDAPMLNASQRKQVQDLLLQFSNLWKGGRVGCLKRGTHQIKVTTTAPVRVRPRRFTCAERAVCRSELQKMIDGNVVRPSNSPHAAEPVLVKKKTGEWRFCLDYRMINAVTVPDAHPLPRITDLIRRVGRSSYFAALDLRSGYWQIPMDPASIPYTAFRCEGGLYECTMMPFGLRNAPATFQRIMESLFEKDRESGVLVYLDDILIHAENFEEAMVKLTEVLKALDAAGLTINLKKCVFFPQELLYLGHVLGGGRRRPNLAKLKALKCNIFPASVSEVRSLLGLCSYYRDYVPNFATIAAPISDLLRRLPKRGLCRKSKVRVCWTRECSDAVKQITAHLRDAFLLLPAEYGERSRLRIETDASGIGFGAALLLETEVGKFQPIEFLSKKFSSAEQRWLTHEREAFAIVYSLDHWGDYCRGREVEVVTDHANLRSIMKATKGKLANWASRLSPYELQVFHRAGSKIAHVDYLSRWSDTEELLPDAACFDSCWAGIQRTKEVVSSTVCAAPSAARKTMKKGLKSGTAGLRCKEEGQSRPRSRVREASDEDTDDAAFPQLIAPCQPLTDRQVVILASAQSEDLNFFKNALRSMASLRAEVKQPEQQRRFLEMAQKYETFGTSFPSREMIVACQNDWGPPASERGCSYPHPGEIFYLHKLWVPPPLRIPVLRAVHTHVQPTHLGVKACLRHLKKGVAWREMQEDTAAYVHACLLCQQSRAEGHAVQSTSSPVDEPDSLFTRVHVDVWTFSWNDGAVGERTIHCLTIVDSLSRFPEAVPLPSLSGDDLLGHFLLHWAARFGWPRIVICDNAPNLSQGIFAAGLASQGVRMCNATAYNPNGNAVVERMHRELNRNLRTAAVFSPRMSAEAALAGALFALRTSMHTTIRSAPAYMVFGVDLRPPQDLRFLPSARRAGYTDIECVASYLFTLRIAVQERLRRAAQQARSERQKHQQQQIEPGDLVLLPREQARTSFRTKLACQWSRCCRVLQILARPFGGPRVLILKSLETGQYYKVLEHQVRFAGQPLDRSQQEFVPSGVPRGSQTTESRQNLDGEEDSVRGDIRAGLQFPRQTAAVAEVVELKDD